MAGFTEEDAKQLQAFSTFIAEKAELKMSVADSIMFVKLMQAYQAITNKVAAHVIELKGVTEPPPPAPKLKKAKK